MSKQTNRQKLIQKLTNMTENIGDHGLEHVIVDAEHWGEIYPLANKKRQNKGELRVIRMADYRAAAVEVGAA